MSIADVFIELGARQSLYVAAVACSEVPESWLSWLVLHCRMDVIRRIRLARSLQRGSHEEDIPRCYLRDLTDPFRMLDDEEFQFRYRFSKVAVYQLFDVISADHELQCRKHAVPPLLQLLVCLRFFATGHFQRTDGDLLGISRQTTGEIIHRITRCLIRKKRTFLSFPQNLASTKGQFYGIAQFPSVIRAIDCTHIPMASPGGESAEVFRNRKGWFSINVQAVCDARRCFTNVVARWPGSTHDSRIFDNSLLKDELERGKYDGLLLGDAVYVLRRYLLVPITAPVTPSEKRYNASHIKTRVRIEQAFGILKQRFRVFRTPLRTKLDHSLEIIVAVFCLHNFAIRTSQSIVEQDSADDNPSARECTDSTSLGRAARQQIIEGHFTIRQRT